MMAIGIKIKSMDSEPSTMNPERLHTMANGKMKNLMVLELFTTTNLRCLTNSIIKTSVFFKNLGLNIKELSK